MSYVAGWIIEDGEESQLQESDDQYCLVRPGATPPVRIISESEARVIFARLSKRTKFAEGSWEEWRARRPQSSKGGT